MSTEEVASPKVLTAAERAAARRALIMSRGNSRMALVTGEIKSATFKEAQNEPISIDTLPPMTDDSSSVSSSVDVTSKTSETEATKPPTFHAIAPIVLTEEVKHPLKQRRVETDAPPTFSRIPTGSGRSVNTPLTSAEPVVPAVVSSPSATTPSMFTRMISKINKQQYLIRLFCLTMLAVFTAFYSAYIVHDQAFFGPDSWVYSMIEMTPSLARAPVAWFFGCYLIIDLFLFGMTKLEQRLKYTRTHSSAGKSEGGFDLSMILDKYIPPALVPFVGPGMLLLAFSKRLKSGISYTVGVSLILTSILIILNGK